MPRVIVFDVNETLLDLSALNTHFERIFGDAGVRRLWFAQVLQSALVSAITDWYTDFGTVGGAALAMVAERQGITLTDADRQTVREAMLNLPPHPEVRAALEKLQKAGLRLAALTNSAQAAAETQLTNAVSSVLGSWAKVVLLV
jgi:2-haloacid dehalogenase